MESRTYTYRIHPDIDQEAKMLDWLEQCRRVYNYALRQRKDWINSRKCRVDACSLRQEYIMSADEPYPDYYYNLSDVRNENLVLGVCHYIARSDNGDRYMGTKKQFPKSVNCQQLSNYYLFLSPMHTII